MVIFGVQQFINDRESRVVVMKERSVLFIGMLVFVLFVPAVVKAVEETENIARLKDLGRACLVYMEVHDEKAPPSLSTLYYEGYVNDVKSFASPVNPTGVLERVKIEEQSDYVLSHQAHLFGEGSEPAGTAKGLPSSRTTVMQHNIPVPRIAPSSPPQPIIQDRSAVNNGGKGIYVFYSDGSIRLKSGEVVLGTSPTIERPKLERPTMERPTTERPAMERPKPEKPLAERPTGEIPVAERPTPDRPKSERPVPDKQSFDDYKNKQLDEYEKWLEQQKGSQ